MVFFPWSVDYKGYAAIGEMQKKRTGLKGFWKESFFPFPRG
jgi:hypothetical protein